MNKQTGKNILVTGGAGYIGAHMAGMLIEAGFNVIVFDDLSTGVKPWVAPKAKFIKGDLCDSSDCRKIFKDNRIDAVMHFAAKIVVPESVGKPVMYYRNNVGGTLNLLWAMQEHQVRRIVFSSTAAVYGEPKRVPITEKDPVMPMNPYGNSKYFIEQILRDMARANAIDYICLRYFNVAGWDTQRLWTSKGRPVPTHLISNVMQALRGKGRLNVCGNDYKTPDGTGVRDFIHVMDLCNAHLFALKAFNKGIKNEVFNLGNEKGFSVMEVIRTAGRVAGRSVPHKFTPRRLGDVATIIASSAKARKILGWGPRYDLQAILKSEWERYSHA